MIVQCRTIALSSKTEPCTVLNYLAECSAREWECAGFLLEEEVSRQKGKYEYYQGLLYDHKQRAGLKPHFFLKNFLL